MISDLYESCSWELSLKLSSIDWLDWSKSDLNAAHLFVFKKFNQIVGSHLHLGISLLKEGLLRLPFERSVFELTTDLDSRRCVLFCSQHQTNEEDWGEVLGSTREDVPPLVIRVVPFAKIAGQWSSSSPIYVGTGISSDQIFCSYSPDYDDVPNGATSWVFSLISACISLAIDTCDRNEIVPPDKIRRRRFAANKPPLLKFVIVRLKSSVHRATVSSDGTHNSPALHWRRGHLRHLSNGKIVVVSPCLVGSSTNGITDKIYEKDGGVNASRFIES